MLLCIFTARSEIILYAREVELEGELTLYITKNHQNTSGLSENDEEKQYLKNY